MNTKVLLAALAYGVTTFLLGWLLYGILLKDTYASLCPDMSGMMKDPPDMIGLAVGNLAAGLLIALLYSRWGNITTFMGGATAGAWISGLIALSWDMIMTATMRGYTLQGALLDVVVYAVMGAVAGGVAGWVLGTGKK